MPSNKRRQKIDNRSANGPATIIHIGEEQTVVVSRDEIGSAPPITLLLGSVRIARQFKHNPPTEAEMENAITLVEDELFRIHLSIVNGSTLSTTDASVRTIATTAGVPEQSHMMLSRDMVEQTFNRLAAIVQGRPATMNPIPTTAQFSATLLILREFMHHLDFAFIEVRS
jgi:exopolyphosphatase/pppGpp-phosphohydrolase